MAFLREANRKSNYRPFHRGMTTAMTMMLMTLHTYINFIPTRIYSVARCKANISEDDDNDDDDDDDHDDVDDDDVDDGGGGGGDDDDSGVGLFSYRSFPVGVDVHQHECESDGPARGAHTEGLVSGLRTDQ